MKQIEISATYHCDICDSETATTSGACPTGWKTFNQKITSPLSFTKKIIHVGPTCAASTDPQVLTKIRDLSLKDC